MKRIWNEDEKISKWEIEGIKGWESGIREKGRIRRMHTDNNKKNEKGRRFY